MSIPWVEIGVIATIIGVLFTGIALLRKRNSKINKIDSHQTSGAFSKTKQNININIGNEDG